MRLYYSLRSQLLAVLLVLCTGTLSLFADEQSLTLESAVPGATGQVGGSAIGVNEYFGWRFTTSVPLAVEQVGGHMYAIFEQPGEIFAALVRLASLTSFPVGAPFTESELIAKTTFQPGSPSDDFFAPLSATLIPGSYALVFGTGLFGASGGAGLVNGLEQSNISPTTKSSYLSWRSSSPGSPLMWGPVQVESMRFVVEGQETSFSADFQGDNDVDGDDLTIWNGAYNENALGDADGDGDSDGRDFLDWQRQFTGPGGAVSPPSTIGSRGAISSELIRLAETTVVPEPDSLALLFTLAMGVAIKRCENRSVIRFGLL